MNIISKPDQATRIKILNGQNTNEKRLKEDVETLKRWIQKQHHLPQNKDDNLFECFATGCKGIEDAKIRMDRYFTVRNHIQEFYSDRDPAKFHRPDIVQQFFLPGYTFDGQLVYVIRVPENSDISNFDNLTVMKRQITLTDYVLHQGLINGGLMLVYDTSGINTALLQRFSLSMFTRANKAFQDNYPIQVKKWFLINCNSFVVKMFETVIKPLVKKKFSSRVAILKAGDEKSLAEYIPEKLLPCDLGGKAACCQDLHDSYQRLLEDNKDWCLTAEYERSDEAKRSSKVKFDFEEQFGVEGNFRRLAID